MERYSDTKSLPQLISVVVALALGFLIIYFSVVISFMNSYYLLKYILFYSLSLFIMYKIQHQKSFYFPSFYMFLFFSLIPVLGIIGYHYGYRKLYPDYLGVQLNMSLALDIWLQGLFFFMLGIFLVHIVWKYFQKNRKSASELKSYLSWNWKGFRFLLFALAGISFIASIAVIWRIGYIPIFKGNISVERFSYYLRTGEWTLKLARLWLLVYLFAFMKLLSNIRIDKGFRLRRNLPLIFLLFLSFFLDGIYGDRFHHFVMFFFSIIMLNKAVKKINLTHFISLLLAAILVANFIFYYRKASAFRENIFNKVISHTFSEFHSYAYAIQEYPERELLYGKTFISTLAPLFPKQIWAVFGIDKDELSDMNSAYIMSKIFNTYAGIRVGIIGEGFINFGYFGIILIPFLVGILFGALENLFISLRIFDVKEIILAFAISILLFLPLAQSNVLTEMFFFNLYFIIAAIIFFKKKQVSGDVLFQPAENSKSAWEDERNTFPLNHRLRIR